MLNRYKCDYCRDAKQKVVLISNLRSHMLISKCLPVDRCWPDICERCREKDLPCSEPGITRKRQRVEDTSHLETEARPHSHSVQSTVANEATPPETPQPFALESARVRPMLSTSVHSPFPDDSSLAMLSQAAVIHQKKNIPPSFQDSSEDYAVIKRKAVTYP